MIHKQNIILLIPIVLSATMLGINFFALVTEPVQATGGAGEIKGLIDPIIDRAITALQNNNTELALEEIQTLKNELTDTFSVDEKEKDDDND
jgi:hypothetical protein